MSKIGDASRAAAYDASVPASIDKVLTAVLSCLNSGMYTASRMLFVLAARREAPLQLVNVTKRGVPAVAILASSVVGFLCVIAAAVSPDTVFAFLLNSARSLAAAAIRRRRASR